MGKITQTSFEVPEAVGAIVRLLNTAHNGWNVTVVDQQGEATGFLVDDPLAQIREPSAYVHVYAGDQHLFRGDTLAEARAFLQGLFIAVFESTDLEAIDRRATGTA